MRPFSGGSLSHPSKMVWQRRQKRLPIFPEKCHQFAAMAVKLM
jgi:hypothetical protein